VQILPTADALLETYRRAADAQVLGRTNPDGTPVRLRWRATSLMNVVRVASVRLALRALAVVDDRFRAAFLDTAEGPDLDRWAASEAPGWPRKPLGTATARLTLTRGGGGSGETIAAGTRFSTTATPTAPAVTFASTADVTVNANATTATIDVECEAAGPAGNVAAGAINRLLTSLGSSWTVTNALDAAGGDPEESDADYRDRLRQRDARYRRGTAQAIRLGALSVPGVSRAEVREPQWHSDVADGHVQVIVGDARGIGTQAMADAVDAALEDFAAAGVVRSVTPASTLSVLDAAAGLLVGTTALRITVTLRRGTYDYAALEAELRQNLRAAFDGLASAAPLHVSQITAAGHALGPSVRSCAVALYPSLVPVTDDWPGYPTLSVAQRWEATDAVWRVAWAQE